MFLFFNGLEMCEAAWNWIILKWLKNSQIKHGKLDSDWMKHCLFHCRTSKTTTKILRTRSSAGTSRHLTDLLTTWWTAGSSASRSRSFSSSRQKWLPTGSTLSFPGLCFSLSKCGDSSVLIFLQFYSWSYWNPNASCVRPKHTLIQVRLIIIFILQADEVHRQSHQLVRAHQPKTSEGRVDNPGRFQTSSRHTLLCPGKLKKLFLNM